MEADVFKSNYKIKMGQMEELLDNNGDSDDEDYIEAIKDAMDKFNDYLDDEK